MSQVGRISIIFCYQHWWTFGLCCLAECINGGYSESYSNCGMDGSPWEGILERLCNFVCASSRTKYFFCEMCCRWIDSCLVGLCVRIYEFSKLHYFWDGVCCVTVVSSGVFWYFVSSPSYLGQNFASPSVIPQNCEKLRHIPLLPRECFWFLIVFFSTFQVSDGCFVFGEDSKVSFWL